VSKRGFEPSPPLREPDPEPPACVFPYRGTSRAPSHTYHSIPTFPPVTHCIHIVGTGDLCGKCWRKSGGRLPRSDEVPRSILPTSASWIFRQRK
jgi:hypothetical protein